MSSRNIVTLCLCFCVILNIKFPAFSTAKRVREIDIDAYREKVRRMFYHAYEGYLTHAYPYDELQPLTCAGHDTWGSYSLTLIDAMDTLAVMGNYSEFRRIAHILMDKGESFFDIDINVSVFETNIRSKSGARENNNIQFVGGLLSAHLMMQRAGMDVEPGWPCSGPLLRMAVNIARKILPAFDTATGMPYGTVNLRYGVPKGETTVTCTAGIGTFIIEFGTLSRLTGDPVFEKTAIRAIRALWKYRSALGLLGNHIDVSNGKWTAQDSGIGGGIDSYFEYLVKGAVMFNIPELLHMFRDYEASVKKYLKRDDWYMWAQMTKGTITLPLFTSLDGYWPSVKGMLGDIDEAMKTMHNFHQVWRQFGFTPEYYNIPKAEVHSGREGYPLRPEIIESAMYLYRATKDPYLLEIGVDIVEAIEHSARTSCGYATVKDVRDHMLEDRMESFFLAETTKYLYLLFDPDNFIHNNGSYGNIVTTAGGTCVIEAGGYIFNTEAHPIDLAAVHCCSAAKKQEDKLLQEFHDNLDLLSLLDLVDENDYDWIESEKKKKLEKNIVEDIRKNKEIITIKDSQTEDEDSTAVCHEKNTVEENDELKRPDDITEVGTKVHEKIGIRTSEMSDHEHTKRKHHLHVVDIASFTEAERNLTRIFMEELKMDSIMKNISALIAEKLKQQYKETEYERLAIDTARKIREAGNDIAVENTTNTSGVEASDVKENVQKEDNLVDAEKNIDESVKAEGHETDRKDHVSNFNGNQMIQNTQKNEPQDASNKDTKLGDASEKKVETGFIEPRVKITVKQSDGTEEVVSELRQTGTDKNNQQIIILSMDVKQENTLTSGTTPPTTQPAADITVDPNPDVVNPTVERFKSHIQSQIQHVEDQKLQQLQESASSFSQLPVSEASLQNKRTNLLSLTTKILKLFSSGVTGESKESDEPESRTPNLADLYTSLAKYPLSYFHDPSAMYCHAQPFHSRISVNGEMFPDE